MNLQMVKNVRLLLHMLLHMHLRLPSPLFPRCRKLMLPMLPHPKSPKLLLLHLLHLILNIKFRHHQKHPLLLSLLLEQMVVLLLMSKMPHQKLQNLQQHFQRRQPQVRQQRSSAPPLLLTSQWHRVLNASSPLRMMKMKMKTMMREKTHKTCFTFSSLFMRNT